MKSFIRHKSPHPPPPPPTRSNTTQHDLKAPKKNYFKVVILTLIENSFKSHDLNVVREASPTLCMFP